jgi:hypothetical protein
MDERRMLIGMPLFFTSWLGQFRDYAGWITGVRYPARVGPFLFATSSSPEMGPIQPPIQ